MAEPAKYKNEINCPNSKTFQRGRLFAVAVAEELDEAGAVMLSTNTYSYAYNACKYICVCVCVYSRGCVPRDFLDCRLVDMAAVTDCCDFSGM